jgi:sec-independent protein translocase protein TatC
MPNDVAGQTFWEHIISLRNHLLAGAVVFIGIAFIAFSFFTNRLIHLLLVPLHGQPLVFLTVLGPFLFQMKVSFLVALIVSIPVWVALLFHFVAPAMPARGYRATIAFTLAAAVLAVLSVLLSYFYLVPATLKFLLSLPVEGTSVVLTADSYISFFCMELSLVLLILQLPLIISALAYLGLFNPNVIKGKRSIVYIVLLIVLAIVTPTTDVVSLMFVFIPSAVLLEGGLFIAGVIHSRRSRGA